MWDTDELVAKCLIAVLSRHETTKRTFQNVFVGVLLSIDEFFLQLGNVYN